MPDRACSFSKIRPDFRHPGGPSLNCGSSKLQRRRNLKQDPFSAPPLFFNASQLIRLKIAQQITAINQQSGSLSGWQSQLSEMINSLQPILSIIRTAQARSQADMVSSNSSRGGVAHLTDQEYTQLNQFFKENPQTISGFSSGTYWPFFPISSLGLSPYHFYSETDLMALNSALQYLNDSLTNQLSTLQAIFQLITQSYGTDLGLNINALEFSNATFKTLMAQFV